MAAPARKYGNRRTHGQSGTPAYRCWVKMIQRCENPNEINFERYGGRGITVCPEWRNSFSQFLIDMGPRPSRAHSIERKDNSKGYSKDNCVWATPVEQGANKRNNRLILFNGHVRSLSVWCRELGLKYNITRQRIVRENWTIKRAFTTPTP